MKKYILLLALFVSPLLAEAQSVIREGEYYDKKCLKEICIKGDSLFVYNRDTENYSINHLIARARFEYIGKNRIQLICNEDDSLHINGERIKFKNFVNIIGSLYSSFLKWRGKKYTGPDVILEVFPSIACFPGGNEAMIKYFSETVKYPEEARKNNIEGRVIVEFTVKKSGSISNVHIKKGVDPLLDKEAIRVVKSMPKWKPLQINGHAEKSNFAVPITFSLTDE